MSQFSQHDKKKGNKMLKEYETLLKNIILSEQVLEKIRTKERDKHFVDSDKPSQITSQKRCVMSSKLNSFSKNQTEIYNLPTRNEKPSPELQVKRHGHRTVSSQPPTTLTTEHLASEPMDSVTVLATQLLQDDLVPIASQQHNNHNWSSTQQTYNLSQLLPKLRKMVVLTENDEFITLVQQAQHAARKILESYGSFFETAISTTGNDSAFGSSVVEPLDDGVAEFGRSKAPATFRVPSCISRETKTVNLNIQVPLGKSDASTMTHDATLHKIVDKATATTEKFQPDDGKPSFPKQSQCIQSTRTCADRVKWSPVDITSAQQQASVQDRYAKFTSTGSEDKRADKINLYQPYLVQLRRQLVTEQEQTRNLSCQLLQCQREAEKQRLQYVQREAELQADLRASQDRESQLIKSNSELRNELRLADYQMSQLQFRLSQLERYQSHTPVENFTNLSDANHTVPFDSNGHRQRLRNVDGPSWHEDVPQGSVRLERAIQNRPIVPTVDCSTVMNSQRPNSKNLPSRTASSSNLDITEVTFSKPEVTFQRSGRQQSGALRPLNEYTLPAEAIDDQSIASITSHSSEDASSLHTVDELEFRKGLAQLDERISIMRQTLLPRNKIGMV